MPVGLHVEGCLEAADPKPLEAASDCLPCRWPHSVGGGEHINDGDFEIALVVDGVLEIADESASGLLRWGERDTGLPVIRWEALERVMAFTYALYITPGARYKVDRVFG